MTAPESEPPDQIHLQGIHPPVQFTPPPLPPRKAYKSQDFDQILQFMRPALEHLLQPNTEYLNRQSSQKPLIHPVYAQNIHAIVSNFQSHHKIPQYMDQIEAGHEFFSRIDNYLIQTVENWHTQIILILSEHTPDPSPSDASAIFFLNLYLSAFTYFHHGLATFNYLCSAFNSQFIVLRDASLGGYSWMTYEEQRYIANSNSFEQKSRRIDEILS
ncbi:hypothetical protein FRB99_006975 [Tulasnella sp. 403]|nr:hypothetical protein FRB99_006975 [Tulasnella sp. 403]